MGMFDYVYCEHPLPVVPGIKIYPGTIKKPNYFQSKDLDCALDLIVLSSGGRLLRQKGAFCDNRARDRFVLTDLDYHGEFQFYGGERGGPFTNFSALFFHGQLKSIRAGHLAEDYGKQPQSDLIIAARELSELVLRHGSIGYNERESVLARKILKETEE